MLGASTDRGSNCEHFPESVQKDGLEPGLDTVPGICHNILDNFKKNGQDIGPVTLHYRQKTTWGMSTADRAKFDPGSNRDGVCGVAKDRPFFDDKGQIALDKKTKERTTKKQTFSQWCTSITTAYLRRKGLPILNSKGELISGNAGIVSCDEFPFNACI